jgi:predicted ATPase
MDSAPSPAGTTFGDLLRRHRQASGLTQEALAERTGLSVRGLSDLERGVRVIPRKDTLHLLIEALRLVGAERVALMAAAERRSAPPPRRIDRGFTAPDLPVPLTPFVGRADELDEVCALLRRDAVRFLTLTGPGGVGKTRLALRVAQEMADWFADGVRFIDLAAIRDFALVVPTIAQSIGLREMGGRPLAERLAALLRDKHLLLVLDNFEQVAPAAAHVVDLLSSCRRLTLLITSRSVLHVSGERAFPVPPLALPDPERSRSVAQVAASEAVRLFVDRAQAVSPHFALEADNVLTVAAICQRLDGLPLAITLAAARIGHLPLTSLLGRLEQRLPLLIGGPRDQPDRLRTMRDAIDWSYDLLSPDEQHLFRRLTVFSGGFTLEAAEYVGSDEVAAPSSVLDGLASLVDGSLAWQDTHAESPRYRMLEMIREYGLELLIASGEAEIVRRRHAEWCLMLAEQANDALPGPAQRLWLERTEADHDNFRKALTWLLSYGEAAAAQRLTAALYRFWYVRGYLSEGRTWAERVLAGGSPELGAARAGALLAAGWLAWAQGDYAQSVERVQESLLAFRTLDHASGIAESLYVLGMVAKDCDDYVQASTLLREALDLFRELGATSWVGFVLNALGIVAYENGDIDQAVAWFAEALVQLRSVGEFNGTAYALTNLGRMALAASDIDRAAMYFHESLALRHRHGDQISVAGCLRGLATIAAAIGEFQQATSLLGPRRRCASGSGFPSPAITRASIRLSTAAARRWGMSNSSLSGKAAASCLWKARLIWQSL